MELFWRALFAQHSAAQPASVRPIGRRTPCSRIAGLTDADRPRLLRHPTTTHLGGGLVSFAGFPPPSVPRVVARSG